MTTNRKGDSAMNMYIEDFIGRVSMRILYDKQYSLKNLVADAFIFAINNEEKIKGCWGNKISLE